MKILEEDPSARPAATYGQRAEYLYEILGVSESTICRMVKRLGYT